MKWDGAISGQSDRAILNVVVVIGQNRDDQQQTQQLKPGSEKIDEVASRLSNGNLEPNDQDSTTIVIDLQTTVDKQVQFTIKSLNLNSNLIWTQFYQTRFSSLE